MKKLFLSISLAIFLLNVWAQKQTFDVISYTAPAKWQKVQNDGGIQLSVTDKKTNGYAIVLITKATTSILSANENFSNDWNRLVKAAVQVLDEPAMQAPSTENGWDLLSGAVNYTDGNDKGVATLLTATGGGQTASVVLMTNTQQYQNELLAFLNSLELTKANSNASTNQQQAGKNNSSNSITGLWVFYNTESNGMYNGFPQLTGGYMRREYVFNNDGTYIFRAKDWLVYVKDILFVYETGTYSVTGNQITITPKKGTGEWWSKSASGRTSEWGKLVRASTDYKLEQTAYTFEHITGTAGNESILILKSGKPTKRDGNDGDNKGVQEFRYTSRDMKTSLIDNPPGFKPGPESKSVSGNASAQTKTNIQVYTVNSPLTGKIWEGTTTEKFSNAGGTSYNTGGFSTNQYTFNADGTYRFVSVNASHFTEVKLLNYETGTYSINGNQLTITPVKGFNEEWSKAGKTSNGNSDVTNRAVNDTWNKKIKTSPRKLEKYTYTFRIGKNGASTALILEKNGRTEREGEGVISYLNETPGDRSVKLPGMFR